MMPFGKKIGVRARGGKGNNIAIAIGDDEDRTIFGEVGRAL